MLRAHAERPLRGLGVGACRVGRSSARCCTAWAAWSPRGAVRARAHALEEGACASRRPGRAGARRRRRGVQRAVEDLPLLREGLRAAWTGEIRRGPLRVGRAGPRVSRMLPRPALRLWGPGKRLSAQARRLLVGLLLRRRVQPLVAAVSGAPLFTGRTSRDAL